MVCQLWPKTPREQAQAELERLDAELTQRQCRLLRFRKRIEKLQYYLVGRELRLKMLAGLVQKMPMNAGVAAEWEHQQRAVDRLHESLLERERVYTRRLANFRRQKQERTELRVRLISGSVPKLASEESDPDYPF
jgi:hypothetical protein